jgi:hypothetical protein
MALVSAAILLAACAAEGGPEDEAEFESDEQELEPEFPVRASIIDDIIAAAGGGEVAAPVSTFPSVDSFDRAGPFWTTSHAGGFGCTIWRPRTLGEQGRKHPVIVWGNGTFNDPSTYTFLFDHLASHGFIIAAANTSDAGSGAEMVDCLDWVVAENGVLGQFAGAVDLNNIGVSGYSQGGCGALMAGRDKRVKATAPISPFIVLPLGFCNAASLFSQHAPMFLISGSADVVAASDLNQAPIFVGAPVPIVWGVYATSGHLEVLLDGGVYRGPLTAWFRYKLMNDQKAKRLFAKETCELCETWGWSVEHNTAWRD